MAKQKTLSKGAVEVLSKDIEANGWGLCPYIPLCNTCIDRPNWHVSFIIGNEARKPCPCRTCGTPTRERVSLILN